MELKTPLYPCHVKGKGKIVPFAGYLLPIQYETGIILEHMAVRNAAGLFDVSHMGEIILTGEDAFLNVQWLVTNDISRMNTGQVKYSPMCYESGGVVDDLLIYKKSRDTFLLVVNASNRQKDYKWILEQSFGQVTCKDISEEIAQLALQGPKSEHILRTLLAKDKDVEEDFDAVIPAKYYTFKDKVSIAGVSCLISRTGYTGEDGFELYCKKEDAIKLWDGLLLSGAGEGLIPCGLGARDTLRLEAAMPLYGHEIDETITPLEAGLDFAVKLQKEDFIGKNGLINREREKRRRVGLVIKERGIAREHCPVYHKEKEIGYVTSGTFCPAVSKAVAMAFLEEAYSGIGGEYDILVRGRRLKAEVVPLPFYKSRN